MSVNGKIQRNEKPAEPASPSRQETTDTPDLEAVPPDFDLVTESFDPMEVPENGTWRIKFLNRSMPWISGLRYYLLR